ncbi:MAG TPA: glycosyltransferase family 39 protein [Acidimicrobiales bacterium]|nr:glycosyltransferase family 39 protein [Acidimicrobiales bacterium]
MTPGLTSTPAAGEVTTPTATAAPTGTTGAPRESEVPDRRAMRRWWLWLGVITLGGFGIRLGTVLGRPNRKPGGDAYYYHAAANLLVEGYGFIDPWHFAQHHHQFIQTADWPPLFVFVLAMTSVVGLKSFFAHRVWCCVIGAAAITVCGFTGREIAGRRVGLIAAFLVAVYPNIWMSDELALSESLSPLLVALVLLCAYRFWKQPGTRRMLLLGAVLGVAMLGRDELTLLVPLIVIPLALVARLRWRARLGLAALGTLAALTVVAPWVGYNMSRFQKPTFISTGLGITLASANCDETWSGPFEGYWSLPCSLHTPIDRHVDKSVQSAEAQSYAMHYIRTHEHRLLRVELARLGRAFGAFHPLQQVELDFYVETRPYHWALVGLGMYYAFVALGVGGVVVLRRRRVPVFPLLAIGLDVAATVLVSFGQTRYRTTFEVSLVLLSAVALDRVWDGLRRRGPPADVARGTPRPRRAPTAAIPEHVSSPAR